MKATCIDLSPHFNARAATCDHERQRGGFNAWGNSFPAEELTFGRRMEIGRLPFLLRRRGDWDHLEADGQCIQVPDTTAGGIALLAFGEMGPQRVSIMLGGPEGDHGIEVAAAGWLSDRCIGGEHALCCSHLHYPGGYELRHLRPVMWPYCFLLPPGRRWSSLRIGSNPLFHIAAATFIACVNA